MGKTTIEWVKGADGEQGETWNPIRGCSRISPGCGGGGSFSGTANQRGGCYAEGIAARFSGPGQPFHGFAEMTDKGPRWTGKVALIPDLLTIPLRKGKPTTWFLSMFDLFHEALTNEQLASVFAVMASCGQHTFQVLTKRAERLPQWFAWLDANSANAAQRYIMVDLAESAAARAALNPPMTEPPPPTPHLRHLYDIGAPLVNEHMPGGRYHHLQRLGECHWRPWPLSNVHLGVSVESAKYKTRIDHLRATPAAVRFLSIEPLLEDVGALDLTGIHQVIVGAESGRGARPMREDWVRSIRDQTKAQGVAFFYKQRLEGGKKVSLPMLDGRRWAEFPGA